MTRTLTFEITGEYDGMRIDSALRTKWNMSGSVIKHLKNHADGILLNGSHARTIDTVSLNDTLTVNMHDSASPAIVPENIPIDIVYEDEDLLIVNKAAGMPTHTSPGHYTGTLANAIMGYYARQGSPHTFRAVNRLDSGTTGVMCLAKNSHAHSVLSASAHSAIQRTYLAAAEGELFGEGVIDAPIARCGGIERRVDKSGQYAVTYYKSLRVCGGKTLVSVNPETGRTHQIRVHMSYIGHPLLGDWLYGTEDKSLISRPALHSSRLCLIHPITREKSEFYAPMPQDMRVFFPDYSETFA